MLERLLSGFAVSDDGVVRLCGIAVDYGDFFFVFNGIGLGDNGHVVVGGFIGFHLQFVVFHTVDSHQIATRTHAREAVEATLVQTTDSI